MSGTALLLVVGVFVVTFLVVVAVAYTFLRERKSSEPEEKRLGPDVAPDLSEQAERISRARAALTSVYRGLLIAVGLVGLVGSVFLLRAHTPANMLGLPGGIALLVSAGALLSGLMPKRSFSDSFSRADFQPLLDKIRVQVTRSDPLRVSVSDAEMKRASEMINDGLPISEAARVVYPEFDRLDSAAKQAFESALQRMAKAQRRDS